MATHEHVEKHFTASETVRDIVIGMADGLTVPFALAAGLSGAVASTGIIITAGMAEIAAGSIAMGLGGYLAAKTDAQHYGAELDREMRETVELPERGNRGSGQAVFRGYGLSRSRPRPWWRPFAPTKSAGWNFMMRFELGLEQPDPAAPDAAPAPSPRPISLAVWFPLRRTC